MNVQLAEPAALNAAVQQRNGRRLGPRLVAWGLVGIVAALCLLTVLPTLLWRIPEPRPIPLQDLSGQVSGTYLTTSDGLLKLVPYADRLPRLPGHVPVAGAQAEFLVRARQLDVPQAYALFSWEGDREIGVSRGRHDERTLTLRPSAPLTAGYYYIRAARDSADRADDYFYFQVR